MRAYSHLQGIPPLGAAPRILGRNDRVVAAAEIWWVGVG